MSNAAFVTAPIVRFRPGIKVSVVSDSIGVPQGMGGWEIEIINHCKMLYGDSAPTWTYHSIPAVTIEDATSNGQLAGAIADVPDIMLIQLGVNDRFNESHNHPTPTRSYIAGVAGTMLQTIRASLPNVQIGWLLPLLGGSEAWNPPADDVNMTGIVLGIKDACPLYNAQIIDLHTFWLAAEQQFNPTQITGGVLMYEGTHPNWRGRPLMARGTIDRLLFDNPLYSPNVDVTPSWNFDSDVVPSVWIEADMPAAGVVNSIGRGAVFTPFSGYTGPTRVDGAWFNGGPALRFDGTNVMTSSLSMPSGPQTILCVFKITDPPATFNSFYSLLTLTNGVLTSEFIAHANSSWGPISWNSNEKRDHSDGFFIINAGSIAYSLDPGYGYPVRFSGRFAGGSSTDPANYDYRIGGFSLNPPPQASGFIAQALTCLCALGARIEDGVTPTQFAKLDLAALVVWPAQLTTEQWARADQLARKKWGP